jgi:hypothetical protein
MSIIRSESVKVEIKWGKTLKHSFTLPVCKIVENKENMEVPECI